MRLIGLEPATSRHVVHAEKIGLGRSSEARITIDGPFTELQTMVEPAVEDWAVKLMNRVARPPFITKHFLLNDTLFYPVRRIVNRTRALLKRQVHPHLFSEGLSHETRRDVTRGG